MPVAGCRNSSAPSIDSSSAAGPTAKPDGLEFKVRDVLAHVPAAGTSGEPLHDHGEKRPAAIEELIRDIAVDGGSRVT